jgi:hypothetical protein
MNGDGVHEGVWTSTTDDDEVWAAPVDLPPPLADPAPPLLNTHELTWDAFEGLVLAIVRALDGACDVRRYGKLGQAQHGLDVVGFFTERQPSVYQAKRWEAFGAADLERAVELYAAGRRPFDADRMVVAVASEVRDTQTMERLAELRAKYSNIDIELWDRQAISDRLRNQSHIVSTFFGAATAAAFCTVAPVLTVAAPPASIAADAILRGPVAHLGLADDLRRAEDWVDNAARRGGGCARPCCGAPRGFRLCTSRHVRSRAAGEGVTRGWPPRGRGVDQDYSRLGTVGRRRHFQG